MRIIRHQILITDYQTIALPAEGELLSVAQSRTLPDRAIDLWSLDTQRGEPMQAGVYVVGTGNPMDCALEHGRNFIGSVVTPSGLVWHVLQGPVQ